MPEMLRGISPAGTWKMFCDASYRTEAVPVSLSLVLEKSRYIESALKLLWKVRFFQKTREGFMTRKSKDGATIGLFIATVISAVVTFVLLWGAGLFRPNGHFLCLEDLEHVGCFIGGVFTPIAVGWAARSFLLQRQQMVQTLDAMSQQNKLARIALEQTNAQIRHMQEQNELGRRSLEQSSAKLQQELQKDLALQDPVLNIDTGATSTPGPDGEKYVFFVMNKGETARELVAKLELFDSLTNQEIARLEFRRSAPLGKVQRWIIYAALPMDKLTNRSNFHAVMKIRARRTDNLVTEFRFEAKNMMSFAFIDADRASRSLTMD
jgi:hypothetical protein